MMCAARGVTGVRSRKATCTEFKLVGKCKRHKCSFRHDYRMPNLHVGYVSVPKDIGLAMVIGRGGANIKKVTRSVQCVVSPAFEKGNREVKVTTVNRDDFMKVKETLEMMFSTIYPSGPQWCLLHPEGISDHSLFKYELFEGKLLQHFTTEDKFVLKLVNQSDQATAGPLTSLESSPQSSNRVDNVDQLQKTLDRLKLDPDQKRTFDVLADSSLIARHLHGALQWFQQNRRPNQRAKLEVRFGNVLWCNLPQDTVENPFNREDLAEIVDSNLDCRLMLNTSVIKSKCDNLRHTLEEATEYNIHTIESYDFKLVNKTPSAAYNREGARIDVRLKVMDDGKLSILAMQMNERKLAYFDTFCLQRSFDYRIALSCFEALQRTNPVFADLQSFVDRIQVVCPGTVQIPFHKEKKVQFVRHKVKTTYILDDGFMVSIAHVKSIDLEKFPDKEITLKPEEYEDDHWEVEIANVQWECAFGKDCSLTTREALCLYFDDVEQGGIPDAWKQQASSVISFENLQEMVKQIDKIHEYLSK